MGYALCNKMGDRYEHVETKYFVLGGAGTPNSSMTNTYGPTYSPPTVFNGKICYSSLAALNSGVNVFDFTYTGSPTTIPDISNNTYYTLPAQTAFNSYWIVSSLISGSNSLDANNANYGTFGFSDIDGRYDFTSSVTASTITITPSSLNVYSISDTFVETVYSTHTTAITVTNDGSYAAGSLLDKWYPIFTRKNGVIVLGLFADASKTSLVDYVDMVSGKVICLIYDVNAKVISGRLMNIPDAIAMRTTSIMSPSGGFDDDSMVGGSQTSGESSGLFFNWTANTITKKPFNLLNSKITVSDLAVRVNFSRNLSFANDFYYDNNNSMIDAYCLLNNISHKMVYLPIQPTIYNSIDDSVVYRVEFGHQIFNSSMVIDPVNGDIYVFSEGSRTSKPTYDNKKFALKVSKYTPKFDDQIKDLVAPNSFNFVSENIPMFWNSDKNSVWNDTRWMVFDNKWMHLDTWSNNRFSISRFDEPSSTITNFNEKVVDDVTKRQYVSSASYISSTLSFNNPLFYFDQPTRELVGVATRSFNVSNKTNLLFNYQFRVTRIDRNGCQRFEDFNKSLSISSWPTEVLAGDRPTVSSVIGFYQMYYNDGNGSCVVGVLHDTAQTNAATKWLAFLVFNYRNNTSYLVVKKFADATFNTANLGNFTSGSSLLAAKCLPNAPHNNSNTMRLIFSNSIFVNGGNVDFKSNGQVLYKDNANTNVVHAVAGIENLYYNTTTSEFLLTDINDTIIKKAVVTNPNVTLHTLMGDPFSSKVYVVERKTDRTINLAAQTGSKIIRLGWFADKAENLYYNHNGSQKRVSELYFNNNGTAKKIKELYYNDNGTVKRLF